MPEQWLQWIVFAASFFLAGLAVGAAAESIRAFPHDQYPLGQARLHLHVARQWKAAGELLALAVGGIIGSLSTLGIGAWIVGVGLVVSLVIGGGFVHEAERRVRALETDTHRRTEERP